MLISPLPPVFLGRYNRVTSFWLCMAWYCCNIFRVSLSIISNSVMVQSSTGNPCDSAGMGYELIASKVCLLESSLFRIIFNRLKYSFLSADLVVLSAVRLSAKPKYFYCWFTSSDFSSSPLSSWMFSIWTIFPRWMVSFFYLSILKLIPISSLNLLTIFIIDASWLLFAAKSLRSSMNKRCEIMSPWRSILYPVLLVFNSQESRSNDRVKSNPGELSPWKIPVFIEKWSVLISPSWWLRYNDVFQLFIVFLINFFVMGSNLWIFTVSIIQLCGTESNAFL